MKKILMMFVGSLLLLFGGATFVSADLMLLGQGTSTHGTFNLIYDTDLDITWYDYTNGSGFNGDPWQDQVDWANSLSVNFGSNTYTDWRLPTTVDDPTSLAFNITTSEMGHLFYAELGNVGRLDADGNPTGCDYDCLSNTGDFQNLINDDYWSGTEITSYTEDPNGLSHAWRFNFGLGHQNYNSKITPDWAIAVHPGLLTPEPVPEPVSIDIIPKTCPNECPIKGGGSIEVAVHGTVAFDVNDIDIASVRLEGVAPTRSQLKDKSTPVSSPVDICDCTTEGRDGFSDLCLKFDKKEIMSVLGEVPLGENIVLTLTGSLNDGTPIEGQDCIVLVKKGKKD